MDRSLGLSAAKAMKSIAMIPILFCDLLRRFSVPVAVCWKFFLWRRRPVSDRIYKDQRQPNIGGTGQRQQHQEYTAKDVHRPVFAQISVSRNDSDERKYQHHNGSTQRHTFVSFL
jgi:hypothetical protein